MFTAAALSDGSLSVHVEPEWMQGRTTYGGLSAAVAYAAAARIADDLPPLRSAQVAFVGPLADTLRATPVLLRRGKNTAFIACDVDGGAGLGLRAMFLFAASRDSTLTWRDLALPEVPPTTTAIELPPTAPRFMSNFEVADAGAWPKAGFRRWMRLKDRGDLDPALELITIADALPPAAMALGGATGPVSTMAWQINLLTHAPATTEGWWLIETLTLDAAAGLSSQAMTIWNRNGEAVATATQSVALFY